MNLGIKRVFVFCKLPPLNALCYILVFKINKIEKSKARTTSMQRLFLNISFWLFWYRHCVSALFFFLFISCLHSTSFILILWKFSGMLYSVVASWSLLSVNEICLEQIRGVEGKRIMRYSFNLIHLHSTEAS